MITRCTFKVFAIAFWSIWRMSSRCMVFVNSLERDEMTFFSLYMLAKRNRFEKFSNRFLFASIYNEKKVISSLSNELTKTIHLEDILQILQNAIAKTLKVHRVIIVLFQQDKPYFLTNHVKTKKMENALKKKE